MSEHTDLVRIARLTDIAREPLVVGYLREQQVIPDPLHGESTQRLLTPAEHQSHRFVIGRRDRAKPREPGIDPVDEADLVVMLRVEPAAGLRPIVLDDPTFPEALAKFSWGRVWNAASVEDWARLRGLQIR